MDQIQGNVLSFTAVDSLQAVFYSSQAKREFFYKVIGIAVTVGFVDEGIGYQTQILEPVIVTSEGFVMTVGSFMAQDTNDFVLRRLFPDR